jgi:hypothetical protein
VDILIQRESKLNQGGGRPKQLPVGRGAKLAMSTVKTIPNIDFDSLSSIFEVELEARN